MATSTQNLANWDPASSIPTLIGSLLSLLATSTIVLLWLFAGGKKRRDFRYALVLNLTVAEFVNSLNNSISGIAAVARQRPLLPGIACEVNGWAGQFSVQAVDFSILAITLITLLTIQLRSFIIYASTVTKALICLSIWIVPLCTSVYAWTKDYYGPVSGNWCWIEKHHVRQRYTLTYGWRFAIFLISLCTYIYVFIYMSRRLRPQDISGFSNSYASDLDYEKLSNDTRDNAVLAGCGETPRISLDQISRPTTGKSRKKHHHRAASSFSFARKLEVDTVTPTTHGDNLTAAPHIDAITSPAEIHVFVDTEKALPRTPTTPAIAILPSRRDDSRPDNKTRVDREIWKMLLLNMYPVTYLVLWIPGLANRIVEGMGHNIRWLVILQSSTQFIGLANATVYLYKEHRRDVREWWAGVQGRKAGKAREGKSVVGGSSASASSSASESGLGSATRGGWRSISP